MANKETVAIIKTPLGNSDELQRILDVAKFYSPLPLLVTARGSKGELAECSIVEETLTDGSTVYGLEFLYV